jgi:hypothetical protein
MALLKFNCPTTGREVDTGIDLDPRQPAPCNLAHLALRSIDGFVTLTRPLWVISRHRLADWRCPVCAT